MAPRLRMGGYFAFALPESIPDAIRKTEALFNLALNNDPRELDEPPVVGTSWGEVPSALPERIRLLDELAGKPNDENAVNHRRAALALDEHLREIHKRWDTLRHDVWDALRDAELLASERLYHYLIANLGIVREERARYKADRNFTVAEMWKASRRLHEKRKTWQVEELKTAATVVDAVAVILVLGAVLGSIDRNDLFMDARAEREMAFAAGLQAEAQLQLLDGVTGYLKALREEAAKFPVLLIMDHEEEYRWPQDAKAEAFEALDDAEEAIADLCRTGVNSTTMPDTRVEKLTGMAERIAGGSKVAVWKLPFFIDQALNDMPVRDANVVRRMRRFAAELKRDDAIQAGIILGGVDVAMVAAPLAGPVGVGVAFIWAIIALARSIHEYSQLATLYKASINPAVLLLADEHDPASKMGIVFDILGLWV
jgi:hypothetical protein